jgi:predicted DNA binding CopG/RHH family protein
MFVVRVAAALEAAGVPYALAGAYALAFQGALRGAIELEIVVRLDPGDFERAETALRSIGLAPRLPVTAREVFHFRREYAHNRGLTSWTFVNPADPSEIVSVSLTDDLTGLTTKDVRIHGRTVKIVTIDEPAGKNDEAASMSADDIAQFMEEFRRLGGSRVRSRLISMKVPEPLLAAFKLRCRAEGERYQTKIKQLMHAWIEEAR